jgi:hypothetical protein
MKCVIEEIDCLCDSGLEGWAPSAMEFILKTPEGSILVCAQDDRAIFLLALPGCQDSLKKRISEIMYSEEDDDGLFTRETNPVTFAALLAEKLAGK